LGALPAQHHPEGVNAQRSARVEDYMKPILSLIVALQLAAFAAPAQEHDHLAMLKAYLAAHSSHGPVIPQPETVNPAVAKTFNMVAKSFEFDITPATFVVNQGDIVTINFSVPSNDQATAHGLLMETYVEDPIQVNRGKSKSITFTATTVGQFQFVCSVTDCGTGHSSMAGLFFVNAVAANPPSISSVVPNSGSTSGGTGVVVNGAGFNSATVKFGGVATQVFNSTGTTLSTVTPPHAAGAVDVVVTNGDGQSGTLAGGFTYVVPQPTVASIAPATGPTSGFTPITIHGTNFQSGATVKIGGVAAINVTVVDATTITALSPLGPTNEQVTLKQDVVVTNPSDASATLAAAFQYTRPALGVALVTPTSAPPAGGTKISISGTGFTTALTSSITIGGVAATNVQVVDAVTMTATVPPHAVGAADVVVNVGGTIVTVKGFVYVNAPPKHRSAKH
jgi:plastocyanin